MQPGGFQIRVCLNPECGLRFPLLEDADLNDRCPICLGDTEIAWEGPLSSHRDQFPSRRVARLEVLLDNIRSAQNVGSILRTADGLGLRRLYLAGITPTPSQPDVLKASLGAETALDWSHHNNGLELSRSLKRMGRPLWVLENLPGSCPLECVSPPKSEDAPPVLVIGNEVTGVDPDIIAIADTVLCLPMLGVKSSFNVAVAFALAASGLTRDHQL